MRILKQRLATCQISIVTAEKLVFTLFITPDLLIKKDLEHLDFRRCYNSHSSCLAGGGLLPADVQWGCNGWEQTLCFP